MTDCAKPARDEKIFSWACPILSEFLQRRMGLWWRTASSMILKVEIQLILLSEEIKSYVSRLLKTAD